jgi:hypothetical protein
MQRRNIPLQIERSQLHMLTGERDRGNLQRQRIPARDNVGRERRTGRESRHTFCLQRTKSQATTEEYSGLGGVGG